MEEPRRLGGRYELGAVLGRGGMAEVYLGHDIRLGRTVAVKTLRADLARDPSFQARFRREAQSAASLNHPAIVAVYDTGEDYIDGISIPYIVMEYVDGSTLRELLHSGRRLLPERAMEMTAGVLQALEYSHRNGIIHRDIKPANVMLTRQGTVKVMDFGIARAMADNGMTMTQTSAVIGTAQYLSPEQARGETVDARSDLYSTGCLLYELLTDRPPFVGDSPVAVAYQHVREDPLPPSAFDPEVSPVIDAIVLKSLAKHPDNRYQSADEMRADLERALHGMPIAAPAVMSGMEASTQYLPPTQGGAATQMIPRTQGDSGGAYDDGDEYYDDGPRRNRGWAWALLALACIVVLVGAFFLGKSVLGGGGDSSGTTVPDLTGQTHDQAVASLTNVGLKLADGTAKNCAQPVQTVCDTSPAKGASAKKGDTVTVSMSLGAAKIQLPVVTGSNESDARNALTSAGITGQVSANYVTTSPGNCQQNTVCSTSPAEGTMVDPTQPVTLTIFTGKPTTQVPSVVGQSYVDATNALQTAKLNVKVTYAYSDQPLNQVTDMNFNAGDTVPQGTTVTLTVSKGASPPPTDNSNGGGDSSGTTPSSTPPSTTGANSGQNGGSGKNNGGLTGFPTGGGFGG